MIKKILTSILLCHLSAFSYGQTIIEGVVKDQNDSLLLGNVLLLSVVDSTLIKGVYFDIGNFEILNSQNSDVLLKIQAYGYRDSIILIKTVEGDVNLGTIKLSLVNLEFGEVSVVGRRPPLFEMSDVGKLVVNVKKTILGSSITVAEILSKTPNVIVSDKTVSVVGKGEALIYLNGKQITFERLQSIPVATIEKIQIISNPSAKYDAAGRAVVDVITETNHSEGFDVSLIQNFIFAKHFLSTSAIGVSYRKGKWSFRGDYGLNLGKDWSQGSTRKVFNNSSGNYISETSNTENIKLTNISNYQLGVGYQINKSNFVSVEYSGLFNIYDFAIDGSNRVTAPDATTTSLEVFNDGGTDNLNHTASVNYSSNLDSLGSSLFIAAQYSLFDTKINDLIYEETSSNDVFQSSAFRNNLGSNLISLFTTQLDYRKSFKNESALELGSKFGVVENSSTVDFLTKATLNDTYVIIPEFSNDFVYNEQIVAAYGQYHGKIAEKINYSIGARSEYTIAKGVSKILNKTVIDSSYFNIFPNVALTANLPKKWTLGLSYSGRINRVQYQDLDPFVWYQDSLTSIVGNPYLLPELVNSYEANVNYKEYSLKIGFNASRNPMDYIVLPNVNADPNVIIQMVNFERKFSYFSSLSMPFHFKFWKSFNTVSLTLNEYKDSRPEFTIANSVPQIYFYSYHRFKVKDWFNFELIADFEGRQNDGIYYNKERYSLSVGISKTMLDERLSLGFLANDVLQTYREEMSFQIGQTFVEAKSRLNTNFYRLSVVYQIGKLKNDNYQNEHSGEEESSRVN